jgi:hypothetical protein
MKGYASWYCLTCTANKKNECVSTVGTGIWKRVIALPGTHYFPGGK